VPTPKKRDRPDVVLLPQLCKGCGRCIEACPRHGISFGTEINQESGFVPVVIDYDICNHCGLCVSACPEPYGLGTETYELEDPKHLYGERKPERHKAKTIAPRTIPLPRCEPLILKGNYACAVGALLAGCRHVYGYPITPSTEGAELMARLLPKLQGIFVQAISEVATINHLYGCGAAGLPSMTFTSSPGFSLMLEGISYMIGAELPGVILNVMRPGPGLGFIGPEQSDIKLVCRGLGHGNTHAIVFAPTSPQEMLDLTIEAFALSFKYRNPVIIAADGYLGQITGRVNLPESMVQPGLPDWAVWGDAEHRDNLICSIFQDWVELEQHNENLSAKYRRMIRDEQRANLFQADDATTLIVACNTPARTAKAAVEKLRRDDVRVGLFQPVSIWPFPIDKLKPLLDRAKRIVMVEASDGQLEDELRLALQYAGVHDVEIHHVRHMGGILPGEQEITGKVRDVMGVCR
jgi:pyruvate/2-oxoacid:ferredoxin oxidoreductase alpha subunit/NAD-dependent dihydropyrimidine dehydrogenase PreA subunit